MIWSYHILSGYPKEEPENKKQLFYCMGSAVMNRICSALPHCFRIILLLYQLEARLPFTLGAGRYAWYEVNFSSGKPVINATQEEHSRNVIKEFIKQIKYKYAVDELYLGGFSQGAIMSYSLGLTCPEEITGILSLSGRILTQIQPFVQLSKDLEQLKVFIAHGLQDETLPVFYARQAKEYLQQIGLKPSYHEFEIGHQVNDQVLHEIYKWLQE
jgi:phospholipase/carboxylesterase